MQSAPGHIVLTRMLFRRTISEHFAGFPAAVESLDDVRGFIRAALWETPLERKAVAGLLLAVEEAVTNVIRHGYLFGPGRIQIRVRHALGTVQIIVTDWGRPYVTEGEKAVDPHVLAETGRRGGLGLLLMRRVTDGLDYHRDGDRNVLTLTKRIRKSPAGAQVRARGGVRRRMVWAGSAAAVLVATLLSAYLIDRDAAAALSSDFFGRWTEFARTAATSLLPHILNNRSDAEFDQLAVGLASTQSAVTYLVIVDDRGEIRADAKTPQRVHDRYVWPEGVPSGAAGHWPTVVDGEEVFHFTAEIAAGRRRVGTIAVGVPQSKLIEQLATQRRRVIVGALLVMVIGGVVVGGIIAGVRRPWRRLIAMLQMDKSPGVPVPAATRSEDIADVLAAVHDATESAARTERQTAQRDWARREMEQAEQLQRALLPVDLPEIPGYQADVAYRMANHVGGDYYDILPLTEDRSLWVLLVADVAGKGFPAALMMMAVRTAVRLLAPGLRNPADILAALDDYLGRHHCGGPFVTAICAVLDTQRHILSVASAGHTPLLHCSRSGQTVVRINPRGRPVGLGEALSQSRSTGGWECQEVELGVGDVVVLYTDGLSESRDRGGSSYGLDRLARIAEGNAHDARETVDQILADLSQFSEGGAVDDDVTLLVLCRTAVEVRSLDQLRHGSSASTGLQSESSTTKVGSGDAREHVRISSKTA